MAQLPHKKITKLMHQSKYKKGATKSRKDLLTKKYNREIVEGFMDTFGKKNLRKKHK